MRWKHKRQLSTHVILLSFLASLISFFPASVSTASQVTCEKVYAFVNPPGDFPKCSKPNVDGESYPFNQYLFDKLGIIAYIKMNTSKLPDMASIHENRTSSGFKRGWQDPANMQKYPSGDTTGYGGAHPAFPIGNPFGEYRYLGYDRNGTLYSNTFFINDIVTYTDPDTRFWVYKPWTSSLLNGRSDKPTKMSPIFSEQYSEPDTQPIYKAGKFAIQDANKIAYSPQVTVQNTAKVNGKVPDNLQNMFDYMYIEQESTVWAQGMGRMWNQKADGSIWYQTFPLPKSEGKKLPGLDAKINITDPLKNGAPQTDANVLGNDFTYTMDLTGDLRDDAYYKSKYSKAEWYTRFDVKEWNMKLEASYPGQDLFTIGTYSTKTSGQISIKNDGEIATFKNAKLHVTKKLKKGDVINLALTATAKYESKDNVSDTNVFKYQITIGEKEIPILTPSVVVENPDPEEKPPVVCSPNIPTQAFDIVEFPASDGTDMSRIASRAVTVNGVPVDADLFFSGGYVFGDDADGFATVTMVWTPKPGEDKNGANGCSTYRIVNVHDTKPRAQFTLFGGTFKENRKMSIDNTSRDPNANDPYVQQYYPIVDSKWTWSAIDGSSDVDRKMKVDTPDHKEFLYKRPGNYQVTLTVTNALGRTSEPYVLEFGVLNDYAPAVIMTPLSSQIARGEDLQLYYDAVSTDGDIITDQEFKVYYDKDFNETYSELIDSFSGAVTSYKPPSGKLGKYRIVGSIDEEFGQETFPEFITAADSRRTTVQTEFEIDNYVPYSDLYTDIPSVRAEVDTYFMLDKNLAQGKIDYVKGNAVTINNQMRTEGIDPIVKSWDMHTYTYDQPASTTVNTGGYPPPTYNYCAADYCGTLTRTSASDNGYYYDYGQYVTVVDVPGHNESVPHEEDWCRGKADSGIWYDHPGGCDGGNNGGATSFPYTKTVYTTEWVPTTYKQEWSPNVQWVSNWYGSYSGIIYKDVRQPYSNPFVRTTADRYLIYISDNAISEIADFKLVKAQSDAKIILIGKNAIKTQSNSDYFIENSGQTIEEMIKDVVAYIASHNPATASQLVLVNETFQMLTTDDDVENDPITKKETMYVHDENYFDNAMGHAAFALRPEDTEAWTTQSLRTSFAMTGEYRVFRRIKDQPDPDPALSKYGYYSNETETIIRVHRKPIALAELDWTYNTNCNCYDTTWVDKSYDLDHNVSDPVKKGIVDRKIKYQKDGGDWFYKIPDQLESGSYRLEYVVKDVEGAWSDPFVLNFVLAATPPPQLKAKLKSTDPTFTLTSGVPASESVTGYELWTRYPLSVDLQLAMGSYINKIVPYYTGTKTGTDIAWTDVVTAIPATTPDGTYPYRIRANGSGGTFEYKDFAVKVLTPIQLAPSIRTVEGITTNTVIPGYPVSLEADTTEYPSQTTVIAFKGKPFQRTLSLAGQVSSTAGVGSKHWSISFKPVGPIPDGTYAFEWTSRTPNGNTEVRTLQVELINNTPPFGDFKRYTYDAEDAEMPIYEGDLLHIRPVGLGDKERDALTVRYELTDPSGVTRYDRSFGSAYPYSENIGPDFQLPSGAVAAGTWTIIQSISDGKAAPVTKSRSVLVRPLGIQGYVNHTDAWENNRLRFNEKNPGAERPSNWFWIGEAFALEATVTDTGTSGTIPVSVKAAASAELRKSLTHLSGKQSLWQGLLREADTGILFKNLTQGEYSFVFTVTYSNGVTKTSIVPIQLRNTVDEYVKVHRIQ